MIRIILTITILLLNITNALTIYTENYPPFNYKDKNKEIIGITTDIVKQILINTKSNDKIQLIPWARAYKHIQNKPNIVLFSMTRTKQRENLFKWVGPISNNNFVFYARSDSNITLDSLEDAKESKYKIGIYLDAAMELYLKEQGFTNIYSVHDDLLNVKKLIKGRINLWAAGETQALYKAKQLNINPSKIKTIFKIKESKLYIAFSKTTPDYIINQWQKELNNIKQNGQYENIINKYTK